MALRARHPSLTDVAHRPVRVGDTVRVAHGDWANGIAKWMINTEGHIVGVGRTRVAVYFASHGRTHTIAPSFLQVVAVEVG